MVVVAAGSGTRFTGDKLLTEIEGRPLVEITVSRLLPLVDELVLVCRADQRARLQAIGVPLTTGGETRTESEVAGLAALDGHHEFVGIHDGARPNIFAGLVTRLFDAAGAHGGAIPVLPASGPIIDIKSGAVVENAMTAQTPQVFRGAVLSDAYRVAGDDPAYDTAEVVRRHGTTSIAAVAGDPRNRKVTYLEDLDWVIR